VEKYKDLVKVHVKRMENFRINASEAQQLKNQADSIKGKK
jgi:hypothetical protein